MPKKQWSDEERKAFGEKMKASREAKQTPQTINPIPEIPVTQLSPQPAFRAEDPTIISSEEPEEEIVGAKLAVDESEIKSMLEDITEDSEVSIYNPLDQTFRVQFATTAYQPVNLSPQERDIREKAGMQMSKDMNQTLSHAVKTTDLKAHKVTRLPGKVAHVAIKQLRNYIMRMDRTNYSDVSSPAAMRSTEERIVLKISNPMDDMEVDHSSEIDRKIAELNKV